MFGKLRNDDDVVAVFKVYAEDPVCIVTRNGRVLTCLAQDANLLAGPGLGVTMIKVAADDEVIAAFPAHLDVQIEKSTGATQKIGAAEREVVGRGGKGTALLKRGGIKRVIWPEIVVPDLASADEGDEAKKGKK